MKRVKYLRTFNLPWSNSESSDDVWWKDASSFDGREIVITEKLDGETTSVYSDGFTHARSIDSGHHASRSWIKQFASTFSFKIPTGWRVVGENMFAHHSIFYDGLPSYFLVYNVFTEDNHYLSWDDLVDFCGELELCTVPLLYRGLWDEEYAKNLWPFTPACPTYELKAETPNPQFPDDFMKCDPEGFVVRTVEGHPSTEFRYNCAKFVRPAHVKTSTNWMLKPVVPNRIKE